MTRKDYQPTPAGRVETRQDGDRWTLVFVRELAHPPQPTATWPRRGRPC